MYDGQIAENYWDNGYIDYALLNFHNVFKTKEEATEHIDEFMEKYKKLKK